MNPTIITHRLKKVIALFAGLLFCCCNVSNAQNLFSRNTGNYNAANMWYTNAARTTPFTGVFLPTHVLNIGNNHTVTFPSNTTETFAGIVVNDNTTSGTFVLGNNTNNALNLTITGDIIVNTNGTFRAGGNGGGTHVLTARGNITNDGTFNLVGGSGDVVNINFTGTADRTLDGAGSTFIFNNFTVNAGGNNLHINNSIQINGALAFSANGLVVVSSSSNITLGTAGSITGYTSNRYIQLDGGTGANSQLIKVNANSLASWQIFFPIGTSSGGYTPVDLTTGGGSAMTTSPTLNSTLAVKAIYNSSVQGQLRRQFRFVVSGNNNTTTFTNADFSYAGADISQGDVISNYTTLWYLSLSSSTWTAVTGTAPGSGFFTSPGVAQSLQTGTYYFTMGTSTAYPNTWYSYQTGVWSNPDVWTLDPSGTTLVNPLTQYPSIGDQVVILNGFTVTTDLNNISSSTTTIEGGAVLDIAATTGHNLGVVSGSGLLRINGSTLPSGTYTNFVAASTGGTIEYYDISGTLSTTQTTYNNLLLTNSTNATIIFTTASDLTINNDLTISQTAGSGTVTWQINNTDDMQRNLVITGDLSVSASGLIRAGTGNEAGTPHSLTIEGNLTNSGSIKFFDTTDSELLDSEYNGSTLTNELQGNGVNVTFGGLTNSTITCNNQTDFYRFILNKGTGQQAKLTIASSSTSSFRLFGPNNLGSSGTIPNQASNNSLSIVNGTLELIGSIDIPNLTEGGGSVSLPQNGALWINSATVSVQVTSTNTGIGGNARMLFIYGLLRITNGTFDTGYSRGLLCAQSGQLLVEGGTVSTWQLRSTNSGSGNNFSYIQRGGVVNVGTPGTSGEDINTYPRFALPYSTTVFRMSGGTLNVANPMNGGTSNAGGIMINSASSNIEVTGGTVNIYTPASAINFTITSNASFYNLNINKSGAGSGVAIINAMSFDDGGGATAQAAQPLVILNNLSLISANAPTLNCNSNNLTVGGNTDIQTGTTLTPGLNTITFNGSGSQSWIHNGTITSLNNIILNKSAGTLTLSGTNTFPTITGLTLTSGMLDDGGKTLTVTSTLSNSAVHTGAGVIIANGPTAIGGTGGMFGNLTIQTNSTVTTSGAQTITGTLRLINGSTTLSIGSNNLTISGNIYSDGSTGVAFSATKRIETAGFRNDGGLTRQASSGVDLLFPVGTSSTAYTPVTINVTAITSGTITVCSVTGAHPNVTSSSQSVRYFWRVTSSGFSGVTVVSHKSYTYSSATRDGASVNYRPARYDEATFTWAYGATYDATSGAGLTTIPNFNTGSGWTGLAVDKLDGEYTAGNLVAFGSVTVYYSRASGAWNINTTWSNVAVGGTPAASAPPCGGCPVVIGDGAVNNHTVTIDANGRTSGSILIESGSILDCGTYTGLNFGVNSLGTGTLRIASINFPAGDFTNFLKSSGGTVEWYGDSYTIPTTGPAPQSLSLNEYYNVVVSPNTGATITLPSTDLTIYNNFTASGVGTGRVHTNTVGSRTISVAGNLAISSGVLSILNGSITTFNITGNTTIAASSTFDIQGGVAQSHTFTTNGNITNNGTLTFRSGAEGVNIIFTGTSNTSLTGTNALATTTLNQVTVNKGTSLSPTLTFDVSGTINTLSNAWLTIQNGTFDFNRSASILTLTNVAGTPYTIPSTGKLLVRSGTVNISDVNSNTSDLMLSGTLQIAGGTVNIGNGSASNNDIEYSSAGTPSIAISSGSLYVNGAIRRATSTLSGSLVYDQTGGTVVVAGLNCNVNPNNTRGIFEIENNAGSSFALGAASTLTIVRTTSGTQFADIYINPSSSSVSSTSALQVGDNSLGVRTISLNIVPTIGNLTILGSTGNAQTVNMQSSELNVSGALAINQSSVLNTNSLDVSIQGGLAINTTATYNGSDNTTTFNGIGSQTGVLSATSTFETIAVDKPSGTVLLSGTSPTITNLHILSGVLDVSTIGLSVTGDIINNSSQIGTGSITLSGASTAHSITSSNGSFTNLTLGAGSTTKTVAVTGNMIINGALTFSTTNRFLSIGSNQLTLGTSSSIVGAGSTAFIKTNGVSSDLGVVKNWPVGANTFTYPVGTLNNYTPVTYMLTVSTAGSLNVIPVNSRHSTYNVASSEQILNYYWIVTRDNSLVYSATGSHVYAFPSSLMGGSGGSLIAGYLDLSNPLGWITSGHGGSSTTTSMTYTNVLNTNLPMLDNTYHFSVGTANTLPNPITPVYSRLVNANVSMLGVGGNWNDPTSWTTAADGNGPPLSNAPYGVPVVILSGARINMNVNGRIAFTSKVTGLLVIGSTNGHNLGNISGTGTLQVTSNTFPAGNYTSFVSSSGGTIEYVAPMTMNSRSTYNNISVIGTGSVTMTNTDLALSGSISIGAGATLNNATNNRNITLAGNWTKNATGSFVTGTGTVTFNGSTASVITGSTTFNNLAIAKTNNVTLNGSGITTINSTLTLTSGHIISSVSHPLVLSSASIISGGGFSSFIAGPVSKSLSAGNSFTFPLGGILNNRYRPATLSNVSSATWMVEYVGISPTTVGYSSGAFNATNLKKVSNFEYWNITPSPSVGSVADVTLTYNTGSYIPPDVGNVSNLRIAHWDGATSQWDFPSGAGSVSQSGNNIGGTVTVTNITSFSPFTFGSLDASSPLPVTWLAFNAAWVNHDVELIWKTAQELNNEKFEVERSLNGIDFNRIGTVLGGGTQSSVMEYNFIDAEASRYSKYYYRIRQVDFDGKSDYSKVIVLLPLESSTQRWEAYPNPVKASEQFLLETNDPSRTAETLEVVLFSSTGSVLFKTSGTLENIRRVLSGIMTNTTPGVYLLQVSEGLHQENFRILRR
jgi:fibronectin-binding autotransporter adhesin